MNNFKQFVEHWASVYNPISHSHKGKNKRFFFCDGFAGMADFMRESNFSKSPVVVMESNVDVQVKGNGLEYHTYTIYFCVRATKQGDGFAASESKEEAENHARQFIRYCHLHNDDFNKDGCNIELDQVNITPIGPMWDAWNMAQIQIVVGEGHCVEVDAALLNEDVYHNEEEEY